MSNWLASMLALSLVAASACGDSGSKPTEVDDDKASSAKEGDDDTDDRDDMDERDAANSEREDAGEGASDAGSADAASLDGSSGDLGSAGRTEAGATDARPAGNDAESTPSPMVSNTIESVGFDQSRGGFAIPLLLFQGGYASFNVDQIVKPIDIAYDVIEHPADWPAWRRTAAGIERQTSSGWQPLMYKYECRSLPKGTTFAGTFERRTDTSVGIEAAVQTLSRYRFTGEGTFESCETKTTAIVVTGSVTTKRTQSKGTYEVDGYKIVFHHEDSTSTTLPFFYDPMRPTRLWLGREPFPNPTTNIAAICVAP